MSAPLVPSPLDYVGRRPFAFYPPIRLPDPNEWRLGARSRSEVEVVNARSGRQIWISLQYIAGVSESEGPLLVVGLTKLLDYREGTVGPRVKRVIEMPQVERPNFPGHERNPQDRGTVVTIRLEPRAETALSRAFVTICIGALVMALFAVLITTAVRF